MTLLSLFEPEKKTVPKCIWKDVALTTCITTDLNEQLANCRRNCDGYNTKCDYYFTQRGKYDKHKRSI